MPAKIAVASPRTDLFATYRAGRSRRRLPVIGWDSRGRSLVLTPEGVVVLATKATVVNRRGTPLSFARVTPEDPA
jgi:hypothetical protein